MQLNINLGFLQHLIHTALKIHTSHLHIAYITLSIILSSGGLILAQPFQTNPDSLTEIIKEQEVSPAHLLNIYTDIAHHYLYISPDSTSKYLDLIFDYPNSQNILGKQFFMHFRLRGYVAMGDYNMPEAISWLKRAKAITEEYGPKTEHIENTMALTWVYNEENHPASFEMIKELIAYCTPYENQAEAEGYLMGKDYLGRYYSDREEYDQALVSLLELIEEPAFEIAESYQSSVTNSIAINLKRIGEDSLAIHYWKKTMAQAVNDDDRLDIMNHLISAYFSLGNIDSVEHYIGLFDEIGPITRNHERELALHYAQLALRQSRCSEGLEFLTNINTTDIDIATSSKLLYIKAKLLNCLERPNEVIKTVNAVNNFIDTPHYQLEASMKADLTKLLLSAQLSLTTPSLSSVFERYNELVYTNKIIASDHASKAVHVKYQVQKREQENQILLKEVDLKERQVRLQRRGFIGSSAMAIIFLGVAYFVYRQNAEIKHQRQTIAKLYSAQGHSTINQFDTMIRESQVQQRKLQRQGVNPEFLLGIQQQLLSYKSIHELIRHSDSTDVDLAVYLQNFAKAVEATRDNQEDQRLVIDVNCPSLIVKADFAAKLGNILNELMTNSQKYAQLENGCLYLKLDLITPTPSELKMTYQDPGPAENNKIGVNTYSSQYGVQLIHQLTEWMDGSVVSYGQESWDYVGVFPIPQAD